MKKAIALLVLSACALFAEGSVIHVVTIKWKPGTSQQQIQAALDGVKTVQKEYKGVKRVWTRSIKVQGEGYTHAVAMEFESEQSLKDYSGSPAQLKWYKVYQAIREESTTHDITN